MKAFIADECYTQPPPSCPLEKLSAFGQDLYDAFNAWAKSGNEKYVPTRKDFYSRLKKIGYKHGTTGGKIRFDGIALQNQCRWSEQALNYPMPLPQPRAGTPITAKGKVIPFSAWPTQRGRRGRYKLQSTMFALDPWAIIAETERLRMQASVFVSQAATPESAGRTRARPPDTKAA